MSWSISAIGTKEGVLGKLAEDFAKYPLSDPAEEAIRQSVYTTAKMAIEDYKGESALKVNAAGSMSNYNGLKTHSVTLMIEPLYGFVK